MEGEGEVGKGVEGGGRGGSRRLGEKKRCRVDKAKMRRDRLWEVEGGPGRKVAVEQDKGETACCE